MLLSEAGATTTLETIQPNSHIITAEIRHLISKIASVLAEISNAPPTESIACTTTHASSSEERLVDDPLEEFTLQLVDHFKSSMKSYADLVFSGKRSFPFVRSVLENQVTNIMSIASEERVVVYAERLDHLR